MDTEKGKVWVNILAEKELVEEFDKVVSELDTDRSKLIRNLMREAVKDHQGARRLEQSVRTRVKK